MSRLHLVTSQTARSLEYLGEVPGGGSPLVWGLLGTGRKETPWRGERLAHHGPRGGILRDPEAPSSPRAFRAGDRTTTRQPRGAHRV